MWKSKLMYKIWEIRARKDAGPSGLAPHGKVNSSKTPPSRQTLKSPVNKDTNKNNADNDSERASPVRNSNIHTPTDKQKDNDSENNDNSRNPSVASNKGGNHDPDKVTW